MIDDPNKLQEQRSLTKSLIDYFSRTGKYSSDRAGGTNLGMMRRLDPELGDYEANMSDTFLKMLTQPDALEEVSNIERQLRGNRWTGDYNWSPAGYTPKHTDKELKGQQEALITMVDALLGDNKNISDVLKKLK